MAEQGIPIIGPLLNRLIGTRNDRFVKKYTQRVAAINALEPQVRQLTDLELRGKIKDFRDRADKQEDLDVLMTEALATAREAMDRAVGIRGIFNPRFNFDASQLQPAMRDLYAQLKARAEAMPMLMPATLDYSKLKNQADPVAAGGVMDEANEFLGCADLVPGWMRVEIPNELYEAIKSLYPESRPPFRARPFDVQLIGGMVLCQGKISEMRTGEGKTIVAPLACSMAAIERMKVHVVTVNDYLVQRDRDWTFPYFHALGLTVGAIHPQHLQDEDAKRQMYQCDVVYGTTAEFGFDYLRDNMKRAVEQQVQRRRDFAIVDEVDSILVDEARTPLIISGQAHEDKPRYELADKLARHLVARQAAWAKADEDVTKCMMRIKGYEGDIRQTREKSLVPALQKQLEETKLELPKLKAVRDQNPQYFELKMERKQALLTHEGVSEAQRVAGIGSFYIEENMDVPHLLEQSLRAHTVYECDRDYIVRDVPDNYSGKPTPSVVIVDTNTGRPMIGRQWSDGLHQAVECKEKVQIKDETQTVATVTIQNFFKMYKRLAGMTGTADTEAQEFHDIYKLDVVAIPTNKQIRRRDRDDVVFLSLKDKWNAIVDEIKYFHDMGRPILVGTTSVEKSEMLGKLLTTKHAVQHEVLNARPDKIAREAEIVENAGQLGSVVIATNMAGRGTDIKLASPSREKLLDHWLRRGIAPRTLTPQSSEEELREAIFRKIAHKELEGVQKRDAEAMPYAELELELLRHWAKKFTWMSDGQIKKASADDIREALDETGRFSLHRLRWFGSLEDMGGLHVIGTERHEARRIDNQLRGRSGRQGDKGSSRFFVSLEDDLMKMFAGEATMKVLATLGMKEGDAIEHPMLSKRIEGAQRKVEERNFLQRKQVLEYDEVMEYQRQFFYGLRQRVLEGRDVKDLVLDLIRQTANDAVEKYLADGYASECAAEYAKGVLDCSIAPDRLKGREGEAMEKAIREEAAYESRQAINLTLGEYMPTAGSEVQVDFDATGLVSWARNRFGVELDASRLQHGTDAERQYVRDLLVQQAERRVRDSNLDGLSEFVQKNYGAQELSRWVKDKLGFEVSIEEITRAQAGDQIDGETNPVTSLLMQRVEQWYHRREIEYPVEFGIAMFQAMARNPQYGSQEAAKNFLSWSNGRFAMGWTPELFRTTTPQSAQQLLMDKSKQLIEGKQMEGEIAKAMATTSDEELGTLWQTSFGRELPITMKHLKDRDRENAIRAGVENMRRPELLRFERTILLDVLDSHWRDHLYAMDQLRDTINFRAFSQNDPRIEYKREGSQLFEEMLRMVRNRVCERIFHATLQPQVPPPAGMPRPAPRPMVPAGVGGGGGGGAIAGPTGAMGITGPGLDQPGRGPMQV
jgi:preprotein translocase subunit SecA